MSGVTLKGHIVGLRAWVCDYKLARKCGNVRLAKALRDDIKRVLAETGIDPALVWGDDPDAPRATHDL